MKAAQLGFNTFHHWIMGESIVLMSDSAALVVYLKRKGGIVSWVICTLTQEILSWAEQFSVSLMARHILVDQLSQPDQVLPSGWPFLTWMLIVICKVYGHHPIDFFASKAKANTKLPLHMYPTPASTTWEEEDLSVHAFLPFAFLRQYPVKSNALLELFHYRDSSIYHKGSDSQIFWLFWWKNLMSSPCCGSCWCSSMWGIFMLETFMWLIQKQTFLMKV